MAIEDTLRSLSAGEVVALAGDSTFVYANRYYGENVTTGQETLYYWLGGRLVAVKRGGTLGYVHGDHLGSTSITTDTEGVQASALTYFPYGSGRASTSMTRSSALG